MTNVIRHATKADLPAILAIYNDVIANSTAVWRDDPVTLAERQSWLAAREEKTHPVLVASDAIGHVVGFASYGEFRGYPGFRLTVEHTLHVAAGLRGNGTGTALMKGLITHARASGKHVMIGAIDAENAASIRFHERAGFTRSGRLREVGIKHGQWLDLVLMQLLLK